MDQPATRRLIVMLNIIIMMENPSSEKLWSDLCQDVLILIAGKLKSLDDILAFHSVCVSWHSASSQEHNFLNRGARQFPWLSMLQAGDCKSPLAVKNEIFAFGQGKVYDTNAIPSDNFKTYSLGWKGWLIVFMKNEIMYLTNVFASKTRIELPSETIFWNLSSNTRAALSCDPFTNPSDYVLVITHSQVTPLARITSKLMFWRHGDKSYSHIGTKDNVIHAIFHHGLIYAFSYDDYEIRVFDVAGHNPMHTLTITLSRVPHRHSTGRHYLLELGGDIVILMHCGGIDGGYKFNKFKLFTVTTSGEQIEIVDLGGNRSIFVSGNQSFALDNVSEIPECRPNHIYFIYVSRKRYERRVGAYNLGNGTVEYSSEEQYHCSHPIQWIS